MFQLGLFFLSSINPGQSITIEEVDEYDLYMIDYKVNLPFSL